jgi:hypothetical protein
MAYLNYLGIGINRMRKTTKNSWNNSLSFKNQDIKRPVAKYKQKTLFRMLMCVYEESLQGVACGTERKL